MKTFLLGLFMGGSVTLIAQPQLTRTNMELLPGEYFSRTFFDWNGALPSEGTDQIWDFSDVELLYDRDYNAFTMEGAPYVDLYPEASVGISFDGISGSYSYFEHSDDAFTYWGSNVPDGGYELVYENGIQLLQYPFDYGAVFTAPFNGVMTSGEEKIREGTSQVTALGYGTVILPSATLDNVLMVEVQLDFQDSSIATTETVQADIVEYYFYRPGVHHPVLLLSKVMFDLGEPMYSGQFANDSTLVISDPEPKFEEVKVYPNPTKEHFQLTTSIYGEVSIYAMTGALVKKVQYGGQPIDVSTLESGVYQVVIQNEDKTVVEQLIKE